MTAHMGQQVEFVYSLTFCQSRSLNVWHCLKYLRILCSVRLWSLHFLQLWRRIARNLFENALCYFHFSSSAQLWERRSILHLTHSVSNATLSHPKGTQLENKTHDLWSEFLTECLFLTAASKTNMEHQTNHTTSTLILKNLTFYHDNITSSSSNDFLLIFLDRSQLIMTIVGLIANIGTSITLIKNGQVSEMFFTAHNSSCGKVVFSQLCVKNSVHVGGFVSQHAMDRGCLPGVSAQEVSAYGVCLPGGCLPGGVCPGVCLPRHPHHWADTPSPWNSHWSGRYASYWNAFLLDKAEYKAVVSYKCSTLKQFVFLQIKSLCCLKDWAKIIPNMLEHWNTGNVISSKMYSLYSFDEFQLFLLFQLNFNHLVCFGCFCLWMKCCIIKWCISVCFELHDAVSIKHVNANFCVIFNLCREVHCWLQSLP